MLEQPTEKEIAPVDNFSKKNGWKNCKDDRGGETSVCTLYFAGPGVVVFFVVGEKLMNKQLGKVYKIYFCIW